PGDRDVLRRRIATLPPDTISEWKLREMNINAVRWLETYKDKNDQVGKLQCRYQAGGQWTGWADQMEPTFTVRDLINCLLARGNQPVTYTMCPDYFAGPAEADKRNDILHVQQVPGVTDVECRFVWDWRYEPEKVPPNLTNP